MANQAVHQETTLRPSRRFQTSGRVTSRRLFLAARFDTACGLLSMLATLARELSEAHQVSILSSDRTQ